MANLIAVALCLLAGLLLQRVRAFPTDAGAAGLNAFAIHVALPAMVLQQMSVLEVSADVLIPALTPWLLLIISIATVFALSRLFGWSRDTTGALLLVVPLGNTSFAGLPLVMAWLGPEALPFAVLYDQLGSFLALSTWGTFVALHWADAGHVDPTATTAATRRKIIRKIVTFPPFIALVCAILLNALSAGQPPALLVESLSILAKSLVPTVLVAVGLKWRLRLPGADAPIFATALFLKLAFLPLVAWVGLKLIGATGIAADTTVLEAGMGPMITASAIGIAAGIRPNLIAAITGYGTLLSLGSTGLIRHLLLPI